MINLDEHKIFVKSLQMEVVPLSIAKLALNQVNEKVDKALELITNGLKDVNNTVQEHD